MGTEWMGRYRPLVAALVLHSNIIHKGMNEKFDLGNGMVLSTHEWQVLEYIVEHKDDYFSMIQIARQLGIPQSSFSRIVGILNNYGLIDKYQVENNKKNVVVRPTDFALELYAKRSGSLDSRYFRVFFDALEGIEDADIVTFTEALNALTQAIISQPQEDSEPKLIKLD